MSADFASKGQLNLTPFTQLVRDLHQRKLSGSLTLTQGPVKKIIQFLNGDICGTASNLPQDSVLGLLVRNGPLSDEEAGEIRIQVSGGKPLGEALAACPKLSRQTLSGLQLEQITNIVASLFEWHQGEYSFDESNKPGAVTGHSTLDLLLSGARRIQEPEKLWWLMGDQSTVVQPVPNALERGAHLRLQSAEGYLLTRLDGTVTIDELLMASGLPETDLLRALYALECAALIQCQKPARTEPPPVNPLPTVTDPFQANPLAVPIQPVAEPAPASPSASVLPLLPLPETPPVQEKTNPFSEEATTEEIVQMARLVAESGDDYAILGLPAGANKSEVKKAYNRMAKKFHPDRYAKHVDAGTLTALNDVFAAIRKSYEKLKQRAPDAPPEPAPATAPAVKAEPPAPPKATPVVEEAIPTGALPSFKVAVGRQEPVTEPRQPIPPPNVPGNPDAPPMPVIERHHQAAAESAPRYTVPLMTQPIIERNSSASTSQPVSSSAVKEELLIERHQQHAEATSFNVKPLTIESNAAEPVPLPVVVPVPLDFSVPVPVNEEATAAGFHAEEVSAENPDESSLNEQAAAQQTAQLNYQHALARYQESDIIGALELMSSAVELDPNNALYHQQLAAVLTMNPRRRKDAEQHLLRAIELEPQNVEWPIHLALLYKMIGMNSRAEAQFKKALSLDPQNAVARKELRALKHAAGDEKSDKEKKDDAGKTTSLSVGDLLAKAQKTSVSDLFGGMFKKK